MGSLSPEGGSRAPLASFVKPVIPAEAGIQSGRAMSFVALDPRLRGDDEERRNDE